MNSHPLLTLCQRLRRALLPAALAGFFATSAASGQTHPNVLLNQHEIDSIKSKLSEQPWNNPYQQLISQANGFLGLPVRSVTF